MPPTSRARASTSVHRASCCGTTYVHSPCPRWSGGTLSSAPIARRAKRCADGAALQRGAAPVRRQAGQW
eukprot:3407735-Pyramimonas_sp.AAC.1